MDPKASLRAYLDKAEIKPAVFARAIGYDRGNFHRLLHTEDSFWPSLEVALRIEQETSGAVPMSLWAQAKAAA
jgi:hypothetical protein